MKKIMLIGYGAMAAEVLRLLPENIQVGWIVVRTAQMDSVKRAVGPDVEVIDNITRCLENPDLVLEVASQGAVQEYGVSMLKKGWPLGIISTGALADASLEEALLEAACEGDTKLYLLSGAIAGIDGLASAREEGLEAVTYQGRKSPEGWRGSHAENLIDLSSVDTKETFFSGTAREAAKLFPANSNVAATVGLAGLGMDKTSVELVVDPDSKVNQHTLFVKGHFGEFEIVLRGKPLKSNPKTSTLAALSIVRLCRHLVSERII